MARQPRRFARQGEGDLLTRTAVDNYIGPSGEPIFDLETLRMHDGLTRGGLALATVKNIVALRPSDTGFQAALGTILGAFTGNLAGNASNTSVTTPLAGAQAYSMGDRARDEVNVMAFIPQNLRAGIRAGTNTTDLTDFIQAALNTGKVVYLPSGRYKLRRRLVVPDGGGIRGEHVTSTRFMIGADFDMTATSVIKLVGIDAFQPLLPSGPPFLAYKGATYLDGFMWDFDQSQATSRATLIQYPWALDMKFAYRAEFGRLRISQGWNGIDASNQVPGLNFDILEIGAFNQSMNIGGSGDFIHGNSLVAWPYDVGNGGPANWQALLDIMTDGEGLGMTIARSDGLDIKSITVFAHKVTLAEGGGFGGDKTIGVIKLDGNQSTLTVRCPAIEIGHIFSSKNADGLPHPATSPSIHVLGAAKQIKIASIRMIGTNHATPDLLVEAGDVNVGSYNFEQTSLDQPMAETRGSGRLILNGGYVAPGSNNVWTAPMLKQTAGALIVNGLNVQNRGTGSGTLVAITTDNTSNFIANNHFGGWGYSVPITAVNGTYGPNRVAPFTFTPTLTFTTPGDVAPTYALQAGRYWYTANGIEGDYQVAASMNAYTTASGNLRMLTGLPASVSGAPPAGGTLGPWARVTLTAGYTQLSSLVGAGDVQFRMSGSGQLLASVTTANVPASTAGVNLTGRFIIPVR